MLQFERFRLDPRTGELWQEGRRVKLKPQPARVLSLLATRHGNVVTREEIRKELWGEDTFVDFDLGINSCIRQIRIALGDNSDVPRFVQTIPNRGYRFLLAPKIEAAGDVLESPHENVPKIGHDDEASARRSAKFPPRSLVVLLTALITLSYFAFQWNERPTTDTFRTFIQVTSLPGEESFSSLSPDGTFVVFSSRLEGNWDIYTQRVGGSNLVNLTRESLVDDTEAAFSPDGSRIAFRSERQQGGIFIMEATGENVRRATDFGHHPAWSPDGTRIVFSTEGISDPMRASGRPTAAELWIVDLQSGEKSLLTGEAYPRQPHWSSRGDRVAYSVILSGQRDIWTISANGGDPRRVTDDAPADWNPVWSPDGRYLYYASDRSGSFNLWRVPVDGISGRTLGEPELMTAGVTASPQHFSLSADAQQLAYSARTETSRVMRATFDAKKGLVGSPETIFHGSTTLSFKRLDVSPDGDWLVGQLEAGPQQDVAILRTDGSELRKLTDDDANDRGPRWSHDGSRIVFFSNRGGHYQLWLIEPDGSGLRQLSSSPIDVYFSTWSPDDSTILASRSDGVSIQFATDIAWDEQEVFELPPLPDGEFRAGGGDWSPNGRSIVAATRDSGVALYAPESREYRRLTEIGTSPRWLHDSRRILFQNDGRLWMLDTLNGDLRDILGLPEVRFENFDLSQDNQFVYVEATTVEADIWLMTSSTKERSKPKH